MHDLDAKLVACVCVLDQNAYRELFDRRKERTMRKLVKSLGFATRDKNVNLTQVAREGRPLGLQVPNAVKKAKIDDPSIRSVLAVLKGLSERKITVLQEAHGLLQKVNQLQLKADARTRFTDDVLLLCGRTLHRVYEKSILEGGGLPEDPQRKERLLNCIQFLSELSVSYKHVFKHLYSLPERKYQQQKEAVYRSAVRVFELIWWEQRFRALRYEKLTERSWRDLNQVYFALRGVEDTQRDCDLSSELGLCAVFPNRPKQFVKTASVDFIYVSIQIYGLLDVISWPSRLLHAADAYLFSLDHPVCIEADDIDLLPDTRVLVYALQGTVPKFTRPSDDDKSHPSVQLDFAKLKQQANQDYKALVDQQFTGAVENSEQPKCLMHLLIADRLAVLNFFTSKLEYKTRIDPRKAVFGSKSLSIYSGFAECYHLLFDSQAGTRRDSEEMRAFRDALAAHSSLVVEQFSENLESQWRIVNESRGGLLVSTTESRYSKTMDVGQVVAYYWLTPEGKQQAQVGYVSRLQRDRNGQIEVAIIRLAGEAESVAILDPTNDRNNEMLAAILLKNLDGEWQVVMQAPQNFVSGTPMIMRRNNNSIPIRLGTLRISKRSFLVHDVRGPNL